MPPRVPGFSVADVLRAFRNDGWQTREGSRHTLAVKDNVIVPIPRHRGRDIAPNTMGNIIVQAGWTVSEFRNLARGRNRDGSRRSR